MEKECQSVSRTKKNLRELNAEFNDTIIPLLNKWKNSYV